MPVIDSLSFRTTDGPRINQSHLDMSYVTRINNLLLAWLFTPDHIPVWRYDYLLFLRTCRMTQRKPPNERHSISEFAVYQRGCPPALPNTGTRGFKGTSRHIPTGRKLFAPRDIA